LLILPASIQIVHAFEQHEQTICTSEIENHIHLDDLECELCHLQAETFAVLTQTTTNIAIKKIAVPSIQNYKFLFNHQQLSFSLRGPPVFNLS
tara:strand:+ start:1519 stop:1797 length:279 start_codon:yes stop_codon:yes gene_type:complete